MNIKDYSVIETEWIDNRILAFEKHCRLSKETNNVDFENVGKYKLSILQEIKSKLKPLLPIVQNSINSGIRSFESNAYEMEEFIEEIKENYINNTIIE